MPVSFSPTDPNYYLDVLSDAAHGVHAGFTAYSPSTSSCLSRLALLGLLGYFLFLVLVLFTHGFIPETIKRGSMKGRNITPTFVFFLCALVIGAVAALLAPLEHATASGQLPGWLAQQVLTPLFQLMGALRLPTFAFVTLAQCCAVAALIHGCSFALYAALPAVEVEGYVLTEGGDVAVYRLPGFRLLLVGAGAWLLGVHSGAIPATMLWDHAGHIASASCILGLAVSAVFYYRGSLLQEIGRAGLDRRARCPSKDMRKLLGKRPLPRASAAEAAEFNARNPLDHFYCGLSEFNPVVWGVDCKMWLYATGALLLQLNIFSAMAANAAARQEAGVAGGVYSNSCLAIAFCLSFFIAEYMWNEKPHLWTYDIFRERLGFKLIWGCLCWYPNFYFVPLAAAVEAPPAASDISPLACSAGVALFFLGWAFTRGANMQKFYCKTAVEQAKGGKPLPPFLGLFSMETVPGTEGRVLCGGFWGLARHVNYAGEILQALALALLACLAGGSYRALLYPLYYLAIFLPRQVDDDAVCEEKYGKAVWEEYCRRVQYRIFPGIY